MDIEINISFGGNSVFVQSGNLNKQFANLMTLENGKIVEIGKTGEEIEKDNPLRWQKVKDGLVFEPIFDSQKFDPENMYWATRLLASNVHHELRGANLLDKIICNVNIPKYELSKEKSREYFESRLEAWPKLRNLTVNGITVISKGWRYNFANFSLHWGWRIILMFILGIFIARPELLFHFSTPLIEKFSFWVVFVFYLSLIWVVMWIVEIIWMLVMQLLLPKQTLQRIFSAYQLQSAPFGKISLSRLVAHWILGKDE